MTVDSPRVRVIVLPETLDLRAGDGGETRIHASLIAIDRSDGAAKVEAWGDDARSAESRGRGLTVVNPFDGDASSRDAVLALLTIAGAQMLSRSRGVYGLCRPTISVEIRRPLAPNLRAALMSGVWEGEGITLTIDGQGVPRMARERTRVDLELLVMRALILVAFAVFAWRFSQYRREMIACGTLALIAVVREYTRLSVRRSP